MARQHGPYVRDFRGHNYDGQGGSKRTVRRKAQSFRCRDCDKLRYVLPIELGRASKPRCLGCGGTLIEIEQSEKRTIGNKLERKRNAKFVEQALEKIAADVKCWSCGFHTPSTAMLAGHLSQHSECRYDYLKDRKTKECRGANVMLIGTAFWRTTETRPRPRGCQYEVCVVDVNGKIIAVDYQNVQYTAQERVNELNS